MSAVITRSGLIETLIPSSVLDMEIPHLSLQDKKRVSKEEAARSAQQEGLMAIIGILRLSSEATKNCSVLKLRETDGLARDCACQIRAIENALFAKRAASFCKDFTEALDREVVRLQHLPISSLSTLRRILPQLPFLNDTDFQIFVLSSMLFRARREDLVEKTCVGCNGQGQDLSDKTDGTELIPFLSKRLVPGIVSRAQEALANMSCQRLCELSGIPLEAIRKISRPCCSKKPRHEEEKTERSELPCFVSIEAMLKLAAAHGLLVLIKSKVTEHCFEKSSTDPFDTAILCEAVASESGTTLTPLDRCALQNQPLLVIEGFRSSCKISEEPNSYKKRLQGLDLATLVRINAAAHSQFTGGVSLEEHELGDLASRLESLSIAAEREGCTLHNPTLFVVLHVFCSSAMEEGVLGGGP